MNLSAHTLADLKTLAKAEPNTAVDYLAAVEKGLRAAGSVAEADAVKAVLAKTGDLVERVTASADKLSVIFPANAGEWGDLQARRAATIGYTTSVPTPPAQYISGTLKSTYGNLTFVTEGGRELKLNQSELCKNLFQMGNDMMEGFLGDGRMTLMGTMCNDNASFNVECYALNTDGNFNAFTFGRVSSDGDKVMIKGTRGLVEVQDPELKRVLRSMEELAVIVPGAAEERDGKMVHTAEAKGVLMGLARFKESPPASASGPTTSVTANMANNHFMMKPLVFPSEQLSRANHSSRLWARGWPEFSADGKPSAFIANYLSHQLDQSTVRTGYASQNADPVQAAVMSEIF